MLSGNGFEYVLKILKWMGFNIFLFDVKICLYGIRVEVKENIL